MNEKIKLTHRFWAKALAVFLMAALATIVFGCIMEFILAFEYGFYLNDSMNPTSSSFFKDLVAHGATHSVAMQLFNLTYGLKYWCVAIGIFCAVMFFVCLVFLTCGAGRKGNGGEVSLNKLDLIPLDLYAVVLGLGVFGVIALAMQSIDYMYYSEYAILQLVLCWLLAVVAGLLALALYLSFVTRVKAGYWWRNTVIYRLLVLLKRAIIAFYHGAKRVCTTISHNIPIVWRTAIIVLAAMLVSLVLSILCTENAFVLFLLFLFDIIIFAAAIFGAVQMKALKTAGQKLAAGDFDFKVNTNRMFWEFKSHAENLNSIGDGMARAVDSRMKSERRKTELITNVSHDIKTPLTSIINYVDLLQKEHSPEEGEEYLAVLERQSGRLKKLTEDLVEASKASTGNMPVAFMRTDTSEIISQSLGEYTERINAAKLNVIVTNPEPAAYVLADGRLLWRVMDNLFNNICKYAMPDTRVYVDIVHNGAEVSISFKNISRAALNVNADELTERFVRGDISRSTEGSGLGLNIAKSLVELQNGVFDVSTDGDLFKAVIRLPEA